MAAQAVHDASPELCTPVDYWLSMTLAELQVWIDANNDLFDKGNAKQ